MDAGVLENFRGPIAEPSPQSPEEAQSTTREPGSGLRVRDFWAIPGLRKTGQKTANPTSQVRENAVDSTLAAR
jgi:hypothetical protein